MINNTNTKHTYEKRNPLTSAKTLSEFGALPRIAGKTYSVREGADDIRIELKMLPIPIVHVIKDLILKSKRKDKCVTKDHKELPQGLQTQEFQHMQTLEIVVNNGFNLSRFFLKKRKTNKKQQKGKISKFENQEQD